MIIEDVLSMMATLNNELDVDENGSDETRAVRALNLAKMYVESVAAAMPRILSSRGEELIETALNVESTPIPENLMRIDRLWRIDSTSGLPLFPPLDPLQSVGGHRSGSYWPFAFNTGNPGAIAGYYIDSEHLYWSPIPDGVYQVRAYGLWSREDFVDRKSLWTYPRVLAPVTAAFAVKYCLTATDDALADIAAQAKEFFAPALRSMKKLDRSVPKSRHYERIHST